MKRIICAVLACVMLLSLLASCGKKPEAALPEQPSETDVQPVAEDVVIKLGGMTGPTAMGMVKLLSDNDKGEAANEYSFELAGSADMLAPKLITGELDIAAIPANLASVLYNKTNGGIRVLAVNTLGVLYMVEKGDSVSTLADLAGKKLYATGQGAAPEYALRYILTQNGIDPDKDVEIEFHAEPAEVVSLMAADETAIAMLPQPYVTVAKGKIDGLRTVLDITEEWEKLGSDSMCLTGVVVAQSSLIDGHPDQIERFLAEYMASTEFTNANVSEAAALCEQYGVIKAAVAEKAIPECNITFIAGDEMKAALSGYLSVLAEQNPAAVGGKLPEDDFYFAG